MEKTTTHQHHQIMMIFGTLAMAALILGAVIGERGWSSQGQLTAQFEVCLEQAPFKQSFSQTNSEDVLDVYQNKPPSLRCHIYLALKFSCLCHQRPSKVIILKPFQFTRGETILRKMMIDRNYSIGVMLFSQYIKPTSLPA